MLVWGWWELLVYNSWRAPSWKRQSYMDSQKVYIHASTHWQTHCITLLLYFKQSTGKYVLPLPFTWSQNSTIQYDLQVNKRSRYDFISIFTREETDCELTAVQTTSFPPKFGRYLNMHVICILPTRQGSRACRIRLISLCMHIRVVQFWSFK